MTIQGLQIPIVITLCSSEGARQDQGRNLQVWEPYAGHCGYLVKLENQLKGPSGTTGRCSPIGMWEELVSRSGEINKVLGVPLSSKLYEFLT